MEEINKIADPIAPTADPIAASTPAVQGTLVTQPTGKSSSNNGCLIVAIIGCCASFLVLPILFVIIIIAINPAAKIREAADRAAKEASQSASTNISIRSNIAEWKTLTDTTKIGGKVKFSFKYPKEFRIIPESVFSEVTNNPVDDTLNNLKSGYISAFAKVAGPDESNGVEKTILGGKVAVKGTRDYDKYDNSGNLSKVYYIQSVIDQEGKSVPFAFVCNYNHKNITATSSLNIICDLMAATLKFL